ncbi:bifunctional tetrahydrofolate synthase/dihydrofolate synthase [Pseudidiomarina homiensis]|uniref:bifunctional tetrahydrofolate synthase/dihydrofolate synthase n=1 Tax=Pseudidiomarina homiensis TaxID=364198 RepID=UPI00215B542F|nr:bifunctional tetrahydrofolate synthase/dihydrofolate synthase [Pseudidiomarina homiensis]
MSATPQPPSVTAGLDAWLSYLEALHPSEIDLGLERVQAVAQRLRIAPGQAKVITVAGTNGKGSTVRYLETMLRAAGYATGVYISPHLVDYEERVRINAQQLDAQHHVEAFNAVEQARGDTSLTYFEFGTLAAFWLLQQQALDVWILEVGLGGRLDAVNCIAADVGVITSVGIDHVAFLGPDRESIAREKAGIFRPDKAAVIGEPDFPATVLAELRQRGIEPARVGHDFHYRRNADTETWDYVGRSSVLRQLPLPQLPLPNAATALKAIEKLALPVSLQAIKQGLQTAREHGRLEFRPGSPNVLLDVAHNPHAATFLAEHIRSSFPNHTIMAVVGMLHDKDISGTLAALAPVVGQWFFADLAGPRGAKATRLAGEMAPSSSALVHTFATVADAYQAACAEAQRESAETLVLVCGSFYTVSQIPQAE